MKVHVITLAILAMLTPILSHAAPLKSFQGQWELVTGKKHACPKALGIKWLKAGQLEMENIRSYAKAILPFSLSKEHTGNSSYRIERNKSNQDFIEQSYTLATTYKTSIINGTLISSHLWSSPDMKWQSTGVKTYELSKDNSVLTLKKVVMGFIPEAGKNVSEGKIGNRYFVYDNSFSLNATPFSCEFKKAKVVSTAGR